MSDSSPTTLFTPQVLATIGIGAVAILYYLYRSSNNDEQEEGSNGYPEPQQPEKMERLPVGKLKLDELKKYTGQNKSRILVSVCGRIFDLTKGRDFYGYPDGPYNCFAGSDASYMLGAMSLDKEHQNKKDFEQDGDHQITLSDWISRYRAKYPIVGRLEGFQDLCPESWREAGNDDIIDDDIDINNIYKNDFRVITSDELGECTKYNSENKWLSICGIILNVKSAEIVYESMYGDFPDAIGNDISIALVNNKWDKQTYNLSINEYIKDDKKKLGKLKKMFKLFVSTYPIIGFLQDKDNKYRLNNLSDISEEWDIVDGNEVNDE